MSSTQSHWRTARFDCSNSALAVGLSSKASASMESVWSFKRAKTSLLTDRARTAGLPGRTPQGGAYGTSMTTRSPTWGSWWEGGVATRAAHLTAGAKLR